MLLLYLKKRISPSKCRSTSNVTTCVTRLQTYSHPSLKYVLCNMQECEKLVAAKNMIQQVVEERNGALM